ARTHDDVVVIAVDLRGLGHVLPPQPRLTPTAVHLTTDDCGQLAHRSRGLRPPPATARLAARSPDCAVTRFRLAGTALPDRLHVRRPARPRRAGYHWSARM